MFIKKTRFELSKRVKYIECNVINYNIADLSYNYINTNNVINYNVPDSSYNYINTNDFNNYYTLDLSYNNNINTNNLIFTDPNHNGINQNIIKKKLYEYIDDSIEVDEDVYLSKKIIKKQKELDNILYDDEVTIALNSKINKKPKKSLEVYDYKDKILKI